MLAIIQFFAAIPGVIKLIEMIKGSRKEDKKKDKDE